jgi:hypothetical protein
VIGDLRIEREGEWEFLGHQGEAQAPVRDIADQLGTKQESMPASLAEAWATTAPQAARLGHPDPMAMAKPFTSLVTLGWVGGPRNPPALGIEARSEPKRSCSASGLQLNKAPPGTRADCVETSTSIQTQPFRQITFSHPLFRLSNAPVQRSGVTGRCQPRPVTPYLPGPATALSECEASNGSCLTAIGRWATTMSLSGGLNLRRGLSIVANSCPVSAPSASRGPILLVSVRGLAHVADPCSPYVLRLPEDSPLRLRLMTSSPV